MKPKKTGERRNEEKPRHKVHKYIKSLCPINTISHCNGHCPQKNVKTIRKMCMCAMLGWVCVSFCFFFFYSFFARAAAAIQDVHMPMQSELARGIL